MFEEDSHENCPKNPKVISDITILTASLSTTNEQLKELNQNYHQLLNPETGILVRHEKALYQQKSQIISLKKFNNKVMAAAAVVFSTIAAYVGKKLLGV